MIVFRFGEVGRSIYVLISDGFQKALLGRGGKCVVREGEIIMGRDDGVPANLCGTKVVCDETVNGEVGLEFFDSFFFANSKILRNFATAFER